MTVRDNDATLTIESTLRTCLYPIERTGQFESSDSCLNDIWETCAWTEQVCSMDAYVDTPWREQAQWWGDARVHAWNTFHLCGDHQLFKRGIDQIAAQTTPDGVTYGHAPTIAHICILPDFTLIWMLTLWDLYWQTGSLDSFQRHQPVICKALEYFEDQTSTTTGLLNYDPRFWLFLDWTDIHKNGCSSVYSLWYLHALDRLAELYLLCADEASAARCQRKANNLRESLRSLINDDGLLQDGYTERGEVVAETSVHAQTLALITQLAPENEEQMLQQSLLPYVRGELNTSIQPSAYWITYIFTVLSGRGYGADVVADISKRWTPMVEQGTTWENFAPLKAQESCSHAWSAHPLFHLMQILGGIRQTSPVWETVDICPCFIGESARVVVPSPKGEICSSWSRVGHGVEGEIKLPMGMQGILRLAGQKDTIVTGDYKYSI